MNKKEEYENLFIYLIKNINFGLKLDLNNDDIINVYYLSGKILDNSFDITLGSDNSLSFSFYGDNKKYEEQLLTCLNNYKEVKPDISYSIKDFEDEDVDIKVYEWGIDLDRVKKIETSDLLNYPRYITNVNKLSTEDIKKYKIK